MPNLAATLKFEIARLARKEVQAQTDSLRTTSAQYRRDVAALKRQADRLARQVAFLESQERKRAASGPVATVEIENKRFQAKGLASHRAADRRASRRSPQLAAVRACLRASGRTLAILPLSPH